MITGKQLRDAVISGANSILKNRKFVDDLNIFPVPDGDTPVRSVYKVAKALMNKHTSFITLIYGEGITEEEANEALRLIKNKAGDGVDINLVNGGQPVYYFILSVE